MSVLSVLVNTLLAAVVGWVAKALLDAVVVLRDLTAKLAGVEAHLGKMESRQEKAEERQRKLELDMVEVRTRAG